MAPKFKAEDTFEIVETGYENVRQIQNNYAVTKKEQKSVGIEFNEDLGLACEALPSGVTMDALWKIA